MKECIKIRTQVKTFNPDFKMVFLDMVAHASEPSTWKAEAGEFL